MTNAAAWSALSSLPQPLVTVALVASTLAMLALEVVLVA